ncbi:MAG TPA: tRNA pseudouridine(55) synthase TruB [Dehalococcoidia bacterium]|nr:tRNA pseudouridine(55) synthase TruB [Dehalococcoidia bacterium]
MTIEQQPVDGLLVLDKPQGWTSHDVVARVRRLTHERRVGHAGTLDPMATGVLVLGIGQGTRVLAYLTDSRKSYQAVVRLGQTTTTYDADGELISEASIDSVSRESIDAALDRYRGAFEQLPPIYSAIKVAGRPLYRYARAGIDVAISPRLVRVDALTVSAFNPPFLGIEIECSAGFYVRSLAHDLGQVLGCGGHLADLRRIRAGPFSEGDALSLADLEGAIVSNNLPELLWSLDAPLRRQPAVILAETHARDITQGRALALAPHVRGPEALCRAYSTSGELIAVLELAAEGVARPLKVFPEGRRGPNIEHE